MLGSLICCAVHRWLPKRRERGLNLVVPFPAVQSGQESQDRRIALLGATDFLRGIVSVSLLQYDIAEVDGAKTRPQLHLQEVKPALLRLLVQFRQIR